jgi:hypothetical protein
MKSPRSPAILIQQLDYRLTSGVYDVNEQIYQEPALTWMTIEEKKRKGGKGQEIERSKQMKEKGRSKK